MATNNWAKVYLNKDFAGILEEQPGGRCSFAYDESFLQKRLPAISISLPINKTEHLFENGLHPFFDNLVAEGWLAEIQAKALSINPSDRFKLLMAFGHDLVGAVSVIDPDPQYTIRIDANNYLKEVTIKSKASMSGVQPKIFVREKKGKFYPAELDEYSTHIAKLPGKFPLIIENEYLCTLATKILLTPDSVVEMKIGVVEGIGEALLVKRFDRGVNGEKFHFEEFAQLLNMKATNKYDTNYADLANFINSSSLCSKIEAEKLFRRILACILVGNTDAHLKNFAMFHTPRGLELTPSYDMVFAAYYDIDELALSLGKNINNSLGAIKAKHLKILCDDFGLNQKVLELAVETFSARLEKVYEAINQQRQLSTDLRVRLIKQVKARWNGTFKNIGSN
jgi:serine/threonine-protein kinase HipA